MQTVDAYTAQGLLGGITYQRLRKLVDQGLVRKQGKGQFVLRDLKRLGPELGDITKSPAARVVGCHDIPGEVEDALRVSGITPVDCATALESLCVANPELWPVVAVSDIGYRRNKAMYDAVKDQCTLVIYDEDEWMLNKFVGAVWKGVGKRFPSSSAKHDR